MPVLRSMAVALLWLFFLTACQSDQPPKALTVFAASSLTSALQEVVTEYEAQNPGLDVEINFAASSQLAVQLLEGAPADVFLSANEAQMQVVSQAGLLDRPPQIFVTNSLVLIVPAHNPAGISQLADLTNPSADIRLVLALPGVPVRTYTDQMLAAFITSTQRDARDLAVVYSHLASEEDNVRQVVTRVALGEADAGIVYLSDITPDIADAVKQIPVPGAVNVQAAYPAGLLKYGPNKQQASQFIDFLLSDQGQAILARWGFGPALSN